MLGLALSLLGPLTVTVDGRPFGALRIRPALALCIYLICRPERHRRERLMELLWPGWLSAAAQQNLRQNLYVLRQTLPEIASRHGSGPVPLMLADRVALQLNPEAAVASDVQHFTALLEQPQPTTAQLTEAVALYRGDFLADFYLPDSNPFEEWVATRRADLRRLMLAALENLAMNATAAASYAEAAAYARRQLEMDSLRESAYRQLMLALAGGGQRSEALAQYEICRRLLRAELDIEPSAETRVLAERIARGEEQWRTPTPNAPTEALTNAYQSSKKPRHNLPHQLSSFIGREHEIVQVRKLLARSRLVTLTGAGGSGKTRIALEAAKGVLDAFPDGVWFVELAPLSDPTLVPSVLASLLGVGGDKDHPLVLALVDFLSERRLLLLLDNCEHLIEAVAQLAETLLQHCPELYILATSREMLGIAGETIVLAPTLSLPKPGEQPSLEELRRYDAVQLLVERATAVLPTFSLTKQNATAVIQLCQRLDGIPMAIELAAVRVRLLQVEQIVARLDDRFHLLTSGDRTAPARHQTLRALIDWSYDLLPPVERRLLRRLSVFAGGFTLEAVEAICDQENEGNVLDSLTQLVNKSLVVVERTVGREPRYNLHETIWQYGWARLDEAGELGLMLERHVGYFCRQAEQAQPHLYFDYVETYRAWWEAEYPNIRVALSRAFSGYASDKEEALTLAARLSSYWAFGGSLPEGRHWLEIALENMSDAAMPIQAALLLNAGFLRFLQGDEAGVTLMRKSLRLYRQLDVGRGTGRALILLGNWALEAEGNVVEATALYEQALALATELNDSILTVRSLLGLGNTAVLVGNCQVARDYSEQMLLQARGLEERRATIFLQGCIAQQEQAYKQAIALFLEALTLARSLKAVWHIANTLKSLGDIARVERNDSQALSYYNESLAIARSNSLKTRVSTVVGSLGHIAARQGDPQRAALYLRESLEIHRASFSQEGIAWNLWGFALIAAQANQPMRASKLYAMTERLLDPITTLASSDVEDYERDVALVRDQLGETAFTTAWAKGQAMSLEETIAYALEE